jgi:hypothetical protein
MAKRSRTRHPVVYEVNVRVLLLELGAERGRRVTLDQVPDAVLDRWAAYGFDAVWLMGAWTTGDVGRSIARTHSGLQEEYRKALPDVTDDDILGSPYAVQAYAIPPQYGGDEALKRLRRRLADRGISLLLDFVCNHTARDHAWVRDHAAYYVQGRPGEEREKPEWFFAAAVGGNATCVMAYGRDPTFPGWTDTAQLNPFHAGCRKALIAELNRIASLCDGVRCDMAMLVMSDVFRKTWGEYTTAADGEFWSEAIAAVRQAFPDFLFIAEAYWGLEWALQQLGFDYTYDKLLYDRLLREGASAVRDHLRADMGYQERSVRFLENHDEPRVARLLPSEQWHFAAATIIATVPGMVLLHEGQLEGRNVRLPVQLGRRAAEPGSAGISSFYARLLAEISDPVFRCGNWRMLETRPAWHDNVSWQNVLAFWWHEPSSGSRMIVVNYAPHSAQSYVTVPGELLGETNVEFRDLLGPAVYVRNKQALMAKGMYFDLSGYGIHFFAVT